jgi:hypothetical protein
VRAQAKRSGAHPQGTRLAGPRLSQPSCAGWMYDLPPELHEGPFTRRRALELGVTPKTLRGRRFLRLHRGVYRLADCTTPDHRVAAAQLALPDGVYLTGITRLQELGLEYGSRLPLHFVIEGDLHLAIPGIFLHRTRQLPPRDARAVSVEAAFISYCSLARLIDAIKVGNWLLHERHMDLKRLIELAGAHTWRAGAFEALYVSNYLTRDSWSLKESETAALLEFAGLPRPAFNVALDTGPDRVVIGDLVYEKWRTVVEYEGKHHQEDRDQYESDIDRYSLMRRSDYRYVQVTDQRLARPRQAVLVVHRTLVHAGYAGPPPVFGDRWRVLFSRLAHIVGRGSGDLWPG